MKFIAEPIQSNKTHQIEVTSEELATMQAVFGSCVASAGAISEITNKLFQTLHAASVPNRQFASPLSVTERAIKLTLQRNDRDFKDLVDAFDRV